MIVKQNLEGRIVKTCAEGEPVDTEAGNFGWGPVRDVVYGPVPINGIIDDCHHLHFQEPKHGLDATGQQEECYVVVEFEAE